MNFTNEQILKAKEAKSAEELLALAKENGVNLEMILKDISTVCGHPERLEIWNRIAAETVENY